MTADETGTTRTARSPRTALRGLFVARFTTRELQQFLRDRDASIVDWLPGLAASAEEFADEAVLALDRLGAIDAQLFADLEAARPRCATEIRVCAALWQRMAHQPQLSTHDGTLRRLRTALAAGHATIQLIGFPHRGSKPAVRLEDACVPLRMSRGSSVVPWTLTRLVRHLLDAREPAARVVVLGDPGSGKSTLCQFLTVLLAGGARLPELEIRDVVPLYVRLRDVVRQGTGSLLQFLSDRADGLQVAVSVDTLARACDEGRAVLIVDGLDEVGDATARVDHRDRLLAFLSLHPCVPVLVASREVGYHEVPLPDAGEGAFLRLDMAPLDDGERMEFARRWYAAIEPEPGAREHGAADLVASIHAAPAVRELAGNRLLITLIALIHREDARLPGERVALFERCIQMFLDTWPKARGKRFPAIPLTRQRRLLETLAAALLGRANNDLSMARASLVACMVSYWRIEDRSAGEIEDTVSAWIDYLHEESGLLFEVGPGVYQFVHRTLQEYLAACWYKHEVAEPADVVVEQHVSTTHREVWLMLVGCHAADRGRADGLYKRMVERHGDRPESWKFLLGCLGEEANFALAAVAEILAYVVGIPQRDPEPSEVEQAIARLWRFSIRHRGVVRAWFEQGIRSGPCEDLPALVWAATVATRVEDVIGWLDARDDRALAAASLAPMLWPNRIQYVWPLRSELVELGRWSWSHVDLDGALDVVSAGVMPTTAVCRAAISALLAASRGAFVAAVTLQLAFDALALADATQACPAWQGIGAMVFEPGGIEVLTGLRAPIQHIPWDLLKRVPGPAWERRWVLPHGQFPAALVGVGEVDLSMITSRFDGIRLFDYLVGPDDPTPRDFWQDPFKPYGMDCFSEPDEYGDFEQPDPGNDYPLKEFERDAVRDLGPEFSATKRLTARVRIGPPDAAQEPGPYRVCARLRDVRARCPRNPDDSTAIDQALVEVALELHTLHAAHVWVAARSFAGDPVLAGVASELRQQHVWVLQNWHAVEQAAPEDAGPTTLALVLALGWTQCLTTARWPGTPRWRALLAGPPPAHWWPRVHWHLCWSTALSDDEGHRRALAAALAEGADDPDLGELARRLLRFCGH